MKARGFTLLEVLIALAIVVLSVGALLGAVTSSASNVIYLKDKTVAEWVALNRLAEIRISQQMPDKGRRTGETVMGGMKWQWEEEVTETAIKGMFRVDVRARPTGEAVDDSKPDGNRPTTQTAPEMKSSSGDAAKVQWTTTVAGIVGSAMSQRTEPVAVNYSGMGGSSSSSSGGPNNPGGPNDPNNNPNNPGGPNNPGNPGTPGNPGNPGGGGVIGDPKPPAEDR
jgi:general secretion pathway protein I